jgi:hypothetical protein
VIAKQVPMRSVGKSNFSSLVKYLADEQSKSERVGGINVTNCQTDNYVFAITEILNTQAQNKRATSDKTYHLIVSFRVGEQLEDATLKSIEAQICDGLGFGAHQRVSVVHHDTDNLHMHIAINKIHPTRYTIFDPYNDHKILGQLCEKLEREFGLEVDNHQAHKSGAENRAGDMERHAGVESLLGWIQRECLDEIKGAQSWAELHAVMQRNGLVLQGRGNGLVITDGSGLGVKASSVARELSKGKLEARFGVFEGSKTSDAKHIEHSRRYEKKPMPLRVNTVELYARYKNERERGSAARTVEWAKVRDRKNRLIEDAKRSGRLKRSAIKLIKGAGPGKKLMYSAARNTLKDDIQKVNKQYLKERQEIYEKYQRLTWADWLRTQAMGGEQEALGALRAREASQGVKGNTVAGQGAQKAAPNSLRHDSITKKGTIIYRVGATAVRDDGGKLNVSRGANQEGLQAALRMAMERYGERITVNGTAAFQVQIAQAAAISKLPITFVDDTLGRRRQELVQASTHAGEFYISNLMGYSQAPNGAADTATAKRPKRVAVGEVLTVTPTQTIKTKGRGR